MLHILSLTVTDILQVTCVSIIGNIQHTDPRLISFFCESYQEEAGTLPSLLVIINFSTKSMILNTIHNMLIMPYKTGEL